MQMFQSLLSSIPKNRSEFVSDLEIPDDITVEPYWVEPAELPGDSLCTITEYELRSISTDSSLSMSCALTDAETDYRRLRKDNERSDPWECMRGAQDKFPAGHLDSLNSFITISTDLDEEVPAVERHWLRNEELLQKMERFFEEECRVFTPEDPGLLALEEALSSLDLKNLDSDVDTI